MLIITANIRMPLHTPVRMTASNLFLALCICRLFTERQVQLLCLRPRRVPEISATDSSFRDDILAAALCETEGSLYCSPSDAAFAYETLLQRDRFMM